MAANEPKVTKLKPGEGAGDFQPKQRGGGKFKRGTPKGQKRTENPCILSDGSVDPQCKKVYQRSVAGRQTMEQFISEKAAQGMTEKDIFMAAVNGLMTRKLGYVGAYLDSKNPGRTYNQAQAYKIADAVMSKMGIGDHPGARLTGPSGGGRQRGKESEPGKAGASVRQHRKQEGGRGGGSGMPETWAKPGEKAPSRPTEKPEAKAPKAAPAPQNEIQRVLEQIKSGKMSKEELADLLQKRREGGKATEAAPLPGSEAAARKDRAIEKAKTEAPKPAPAKAQTKPAPTPTPEPEPAAPEPPEAEPEQTQLRATDEQITNTFRQKYNEYLNSAFEQAKYDARKFKRVAPEKSQIKLSDDEIADAAQEAIDELSETSQIDKNKAIEAINRKFKLNIAPPEEEQPQPEQKQASKEAPQAPEPESQPLVENQLKGKVASEINSNQLTPDDSMLLLDYKSAMRRLRVGQGMTGGQIEGYKWGVSRGLPATPEDEDKLSSSKKEPAEDKVPPVQEAKEAIKKISASVSSPEEFKREVMRQLPLYLGPENTAAKLKGRADVEARRLAREEKELGKPPAAPARRGKAPVQPSLLTPSGKARKFPQPEPAPAETQQKSPQPSEPSGGPDVRQSLKAANLSMSGAPESAGGSGISLESEELGREIPLSDPMAKKILAKAGLTPEQAESYWMDRLREMGALEDEQAPTEPQQKAPKSKGGFKAPAQARRAQGGGGFTPSPKIVQDVKAAATQAKSLEDFKSYLYNKQPSLFGKRGFDTPESQNIPSTPSEPAPETQPTVPEAAGAGKPGQQSLFRKGTMTPRTGRGFGGK